MEQPALRGRLAGGEFTQGLLVAVAISAMSSSADGAVDGAVQIGSGLGIVAAVFAVAGSWLSVIAHWFYSAVSAVGFVYDALQFIGSNGCHHGPAPAIRIVVVLLLVLVAATMFTASVLTVRRMTAPAIGTALFGGLAILIAASTFITAGDSSQRTLFIAALIPLSGVLGWCVVKATDIVVAVGGVAFGMQSVYAAAVDSGCGSANYSGVVLIIVFCGAYFATRAVCAPFAGRR